MFSFLPVKGNLFISIYHSGKGLLVPGWCSQKWFAIPIERLPEFSVPVTVFGFFFW